MILGIDPGVANTGWAVVDDSGGEPRLVDCGVIETSKREPVGVRLGQIDDGLREIVHKYKISKMAVELLYFARNARSAMGVAEAIGVVRLSGCREGLEVVGYTPLQVKMALVGYGRAEKRQVEIMVRQSLGMEEEISPSHASDAAAVALTAMYSKKW